MVRLGFFRSRSSFEKKIFSGFSKSSVSDTSSSSTGPEQMEPTEGTMQTIRFFQRIRFQRLPCSNNQATVSKEQERWYSPNERKTDSEGTPE